jgi:hypothetical protein
MGQFQAYDLQEDECWERKRMVQPCHNPGLSGWSPPVRSPDLSKKQLAGTHLTAADYEFTLKLRSQLFR